jgi:carbon storage regulator CsrA
MLVVSRKCQEGIVLCGLDGSQCDCRITVVSIRGGRVRLGIEADPRTTVRRAEVLARNRPDELPGHSIEASETPSLRASPIQPGHAVELRPRTFGTGAS